MTFADRDIIAKFCRCYAVSCHHGIKTAVIYPLYGSNCHSQFWMITVGTRSALGETLGCFSLVLGEQTIAPDVCRIFTRARRNTPVDFSCLFNFSAHLPVAICLLTRHCTRCTLVVLSVPYPLPVRVSSSLQVTYTFITHAPGVSAPLYK